MKKTIVINLIGAPSYGKSVTAGLIFAELKMQGYSAEYVQEYVKHLVWKGDLDTIKNQYYVSTEQYKLLKCVDGKVDYIVTDGSLLLGMYYNRTYVDNVCNVQKTHEKIKGYLEEFENVYILLEKGDYPFEKEGRIHSYEESLQIQAGLKNLLKELNLKYLTIKSDRNSIPSILKYISENKINT